MILIFKKSITIQSLKFLFQTSTSNCLAILLIDAMFCIIPIVSAKLLSEMINMLSGNNLTNSNIMNLLLVYISLTVISKVLTPIRTNVNEHMSDLLSMKSEAKLNEKIVSFKMIDCFEDTNFFDDLQLAKSGSGNRLVSVLQMFSSVLRGIISISLTFGYMIQVNLLIGLISLLSLLPNTIFEFWVAKKRVALFKSRTEETRKIGYYSSILNSPSYAKEIRLFGIIDYIKNKYQNLFESEFKRVNLQRNKYLVIGIICNILCAIVNSYSLYWFISSAIYSNGAAGNIVLYTSLLPQFVSGVQMLINGVVYTKSNNYYLKYFFDFLNKEVASDNGNIKLCDSNIKIKFDNVCFKYPNSNKYAINNINCEFSKPSLVAIVGENGSGKSTFIKLVLRLFDSTSGEIYYNNKNIKKYDINSLRKHMSGVFQSPARFLFTIKENISFGKAEQQISDDEALKSLSEANLELNEKQFDKGINTQLGKQFTEGIEMSGGQWQKLSLARSLVSDSDILVFDEASAELDPKAEHNFYKTVRKISKDKIAFYVTHRLSGTKDADLILVFKDGKIVEQGTHSELLSNKGEYYKLYSSQANGYDLEICSR